MMTRRVVLLAFLLPVAASGCASEAVFSDVDAAKVAALMADNMEPDRPMLIKRHMFAVDYELWLKVSRTWTGRVCATAKCTSGTPYGSLQKHRHPEQEKIILAELIERVQREAGGKLASCSFSELRNIRPVAVHITDDSAAVALYGMSPSPMLKTLRDGMSDIIWHLNRRSTGGYSYPDNGIEFSIRRTDGEQAVYETVRLTVEQDITAVVITARAWDLEKPDETIGGAELEDLVRLAAVYLLYKHDKLATSPVRDK